MNRPSTFVLTGSASGIGRHLTDTLVRRGSHVLASDVRLDALQAQAEASGWPAEQTRLAKLDVRDPVAWDQVLDEALAAFGHVDVVMNIAGYLHPGYVHQVEPEQVHRHFDINAKGVIFGSRAAAQRMIRQGHGHIINISSMAGLVPVPGLALYSASKYAVRAFSLAVAQELRPHGVSVTVICLDPVETPMLELQKDYREAAITFSASRILTVEDVARVILGPVLTRRPLQVIVPWHRGWLARLVDTFPELATTLYPLFQHRGLDRQANTRR